MIAVSNWRAEQKWRRREGVDGILDQPHPQLGLLRDLWCARRGVECKVSDNY